MYYLAVEGGRAPRHEHPTEDAAKAEALRLAGLTQKRVSVYRLIEIVTPGLPQQGGKDELV